MSEDQIDKVLEVLVLAESKLKRARYHLVLAPVHKEKQNWKPIVEEATQSLVDLLRGVV